MNGAPFNSWPIDAGPFMAPFLDPAIPTDIHGTITEAPGYADETSLIAGVAGQPDGNALIRPATGYPDSTSTIKEA